MASSANADISVSRSRASHRRADTPPISRADARARRRAQAGEKARSCDKKANNDGEFRVFTRVLSVSSFRKISDFVHRFRSSSFEPVR